MSDDTPIRFDPFKVREAVTHCVSQFGSPEQSRTLAALVNQHGVNIHPYRGGHALVCAGIHFGTTPGDALLARQDAPGVTGHAISHPDGYEVVEDDHAA